MPNADPEANNACEQEDKQVTLTAISCSDGQSDSQAHSQAQLNQKDPSSMAPILGKQGDEIPLNSSQFELREWAKTKIRLLDSNACEPRNGAIYFQNLSVRGSDSSIRIQPTVLSTLMSPALKIKNLFSQKEASQHGTTILHEMAGLLSSGELLLVLGRPSSGRSTFLKTITGYHEGLTLYPNSSIEYSGIEFTRVMKQFGGDMVYNDEEDHHFPHLTVGETIEFAAYSRAPQKRLDDMSRDEYVKTVISVVLALFGLSHTADTKVGNNYVRGVSGGERKRVSIAEMTLARASIAAWDNSTRGLDANSALDFVQTLRLSATAMKTCHVAALSQASEPIYNTFDNVTVLYEGRQIYFGPCQQAVAFFEEMGWKRHPRQLSTDFLTAITNPSEREPVKGMEEKVPRTPEEFETYWKQSPECEILRQRIKWHQQTFAARSALEEEKMNHSKHAEQANHVRSSSPYLLSVPMQLRLCIVRAYRRSLNDHAGIIATAIVQNVVAVLIGSLFYNTPNTSEGLAQRASVIFLAVLTNNLIASLEITVLYSQRPIVEKQVRYAFVRPFTEAFAGAIVDLPVKFFRCLFASLIIYFLANLRREPGHFFIFLLLQLTSVVTMSGLFRCLATVTRAVGQAMALAGIITICVAVYTGFMVPQSDMRPWLGWIRWINPIFYTFEAALVNEFHGLRSKCVEYIPSYSSLQSPYFTCSVVGSIAGEHFVSGDVYLESKYGYTYTHLWRNVGILFCFLISFHVLYLILTDFTPVATSTAKTLVFLSKRVSKRLSYNDVESGSQPKSLKILPRPTNTTSSALLPEQKDIFSWRAISYDIPVKGGTRRLLEDVNGWVKPGTLTALMGLSGAGKTTLLDVLAQRITIGVVTGDMFVGGNTLGTSFRRQTGYVEQNDLHMETSTIREALRFSAILRQPRSTPLSEKHAFVEDVIRVLKMEDFADAIIGVPGEGLNLEKRKLLTIGVELAAKPELLIFLDEPTSGLDSQTSFAICAFMKKLAAHGQAVLATIHQPGTVMFEQFDRLLLLAKGGKTAYFGDLGDHCRTLLDYFESNGARPCGPTENPAEYMFEVIGEGSQASSSSIDWVQVWQQSPQYDEVLNQLNHISSNSSGMTIPAKRSDVLELAAPFSSQVYEVVKRDFQQYFREPDYIKAKLSLGIFSGLFIGFSFWKSNNSQQGFQNTLFSLFLLCTVFSTMVNQIMPKFVGRRALFELREGPSRTYSWAAFLISQIAVELSWQILLGICTWASFFFSVYGTNQSPERQGLVLLFVVQFFIFASSFAHLIGAAMPNAVVGGMVALFAFLMSLLSNGIMQPPDVLPKFWLYMHRVSPLTYYVGGISATALHGRPIHCSDQELMKFDAPPGQTCGNYLAEYLKTGSGNLENPLSTGKCHYCPLRSADQYLSDRDISWDHRWWNFGIIWAYVAFNIVGVILLYYLFRVLPRLKGKNAK